MRLACTALCLAAATIALPRGADAGREDDALQAFEDVFGKQGEFNVSPLPKRLQNGLTKLLEHKGVRARPARREPASQRAAAAGLLA